MRTALSFLTLLLAALTLSASQGPSICVVDFMSADLAGLKRFVDGRNKPLEIPPAQVGGDNVTVNDNRSSLLANIMIGVSGTGAETMEWPGARELILVKDAELKLKGQAMRQEMERKILKRVMESEARPVIIGARQFEALLAEKVPGIRMVPRQVLYGAMGKLAAAPDFPVDFLKRLAAESGVTHIVTGTVSDIRSSSRKFDGYGISTETTVYELDLMVRAVSIVDGTVAAGGVFTGRARQRVQPGMEVLDNNVYQTAFNAALNAAAEDFAIKLKALVPAAAGADGTNKEKR